MITPPPQNIVRDAVAAALAEDLGLSGDITSASCIPAEAVATAGVNARAPGVLAGLAPALETFAQVDPDLKIDVQAKDGARLAPGDRILTFSGRARSILTAERTALNFLGHLSGIATATASFVDAVKDTDAQIVCTRKTTPGLRAFDKYAVRCGGGRNHRFGLFDAVMIKDNHIAAGGGVASTIARTKQALGHTVKIEVEIDELAQLQEAISGGADIILLDNMSTDELRQAVALAADAVVLEASGGVTLDTVNAIAQTGVDYISTGWITHSAPNLDLGMDID